MNNFERKSPLQIAADEIAAGGKACWMLEDPSRVLNSYSFTGTSWTQKFGNFRDQLEEQKPEFKKVPIIAAFKMAENYVHTADAYDALRRELKDIETWYETADVLGPGGEVAFQLHRLNVIRLIRPGDSVKWLESYAKPNSLIIEVPFDIQVRREFPLKDPEELELYQEGKLTYSNKNVVNNIHTCYIKQPWRIMTLEEALKEERLRDLLAPLDPEPEDPHDDIFRRWASVKDVPEDLRDAVEMFNRKARSNVDGVPVVPSTAKDPDVDLWLMRAAKPMQPLKKWKQEIDKDGHIYEQAYLLEGKHVRVETCKKAVLSHTGRLEIKEALKVEEAWDEFLATLDKTTRDELLKMRQDIDTMYCPHCGKPFRFSVTTVLKECPHCLKLIESDEAYTVSDINPNWIGRDAEGNLVIDITRDSDNDFYDEIENEDEDESSDEE